MEEAGGIELNSDEWFDEVFGDGAESSGGDAPAADDADGVVGGDAPADGDVKEEKCKAEPLAPPPKPVVHRTPRDLKAEAISLPHLLTHMPYNPYCEACKLAKMTRKQAWRQHKEPDAKPKKFGDLVSADYIVAQSEESMGVMQ